MKNQHEALEKKLGIVFNNKKLLENVFVHRSFLNENKSFHLPSNEKLEFLGDSVLSLITSVYLYKHYPRLAEGDYTEIKAAIVRTESLTEAAVSLALGECIYLSKGQKQEGGKKNKNILADCFEALIAGIFLDRGFDCAYDFVIKYLYEQKLDYIITNRTYLSPKSRLQEYSQGRYKTTPVYIVLEERGPEHKRTFKVTVMINKKKLAVGNGLSKKEAEEQAAKIALGKLA